MLSAQADPRGDWRTASTPHFRIHYQAQHRSLALEAASEAESAYAALSGVLRPPRRTIDMVIADNIDLSNGVATTYPVPRVVIFAQPPAGDIQLGAYDRWLRLVITHELAHVFHLDLARGWWGLGRKVLGRAPFLFPNQYSPGWVREGLAVFYESRLTDAGRLEGSFHRAVTSARDVSLSEASINTSIWPGGLRAYAHGGAFFEAAAERAGDTAVAAFVRRGAGKLLPWVQLSSAFRQSAGVGIGAMWSEWQGGVERVQRVQRVAIASRQRVPVAPRLSPDGRHLLMVFSDGRSPTRLSVIDLATRERRTIGRLNAPSGLAWESDTSFIVSQLDYLDAYTLRSDLWRMTLGGSETRLTRGARILGFDVSRGGAIVAAQVVPGGTRLVLLDSAGGAPRPITTGDDWADPRWHPSGSTIVAVRVRFGQHDIVELDRTGTLRRQITNDAETDLAPAFTPDGASIYWSREVSGRQQIVRLSASGTRVVSGERSGAYAPAVGRDSLWYLGYRGDGYALTMADTLGGRVVASSAGHRVRGPLSIDSLREKHYSPFPALLPQFWIPLAYAADGGGWLGAITSGGDPLDRHAYTATLELGTGVFRGTWRGALAWNAAGPGTTRLDLSLSRNPRAFRVDTVSQDLACCFSDNNAGAGITFVRRGWRSASTVRAGVLFDNDGAADRAGATLGASWSRTEGAPVSISTLDGARLSAALRFRRRLDRPVINSADLSLRAAVFRSQGGGTLFARPVFAVRAAGVGLVGNDNLAFSVGGESGGSVPILPGFLSAGISRAYPVRGYPGGFLLGRHAAALSVEERIPVALIGRNLGLLPVGLEHVHAALFADGGMAWSRAHCGAGSDGRCPRAIASVGAELGTIIMLGYDFGLLVRGGAGVRLRHASGVGAYAAVGASF